MEIIDRLSKLSALMLLGCSCLPALAVSTPVNGYVLERVVILSRHGVRSPTKQTDLMNNVTPDKWPQWPVQAGYLTPQGEHLMTLMGGFYRDYFRSHNLLPAQGCPTDGSLYVWADIDQRTRLTGQAFLAGVAPECDLKIHHQADLKTTDALFHPVEAGICKLDKQQTQQAVEKQLGAPLATLSQRYALPLAQMGEILNFAASPYCKEMQTKGLSCDFASFTPNQIHLSPNGQKVSLSGPLALSSTLSEIFLLQYAQGMPEVAWQRLSGEDNWRSLMSLHNEQFNLMAKTPYIASHKGTPLLKEISAALAGQQGTLKRPAHNRILFIAGHDTNIANIAGMLGLNWELPHQPDNTPPGGGLVFELWNNPQDHQQYVSVKMFYQTMEQLRNGEKLDMHHPAGMVQVTIAGCENSNSSGLCSLTDLQKKVSQAIQPVCQLSMQ